MNRMDSPLSGVCSPAVPHAVESCRWYCLAALGCLVDPAVIPDAACATMADWLIKQIYLPFSIPSGVETAVANLCYSYRTLSPAMALTTLLFSPHGNKTLSLRSNLAAGQKVQLALLQHFLFFAWRQTVVCHPRVAAFWWQGQCPECAVIWEMSQQRRLSACRRRSVTS